MGVLQNIKAIILEAGTLFDHTICSTKSIMCEMSITDKMTPIKYVAWLVAVAVTLNLIFLSCSKEESSEMKPERELSMPERVESELLSIASKGWVPLVDTLAYFHDNFIKQGKFEGIGPDKVHYELKAVLGKDSLVTLFFNIQDSTHLTAYGKLKPVTLAVKALGTEISVSKTCIDSTILNADAISVIMPDRFMTGGKGNAQLLFQNRRVGFITREAFENEDYTVGKYLVLHYYDDVRTFAFYEY